MRSLLLVGRGSLVDSQAADSVYSYAALARALGHFQDVGVGFAEQEPSLRQALRLSASTDVTIVPLTAQADPLTQTVIPRELGLGHQGAVPPGGVTRTMGGKTVRYLPALDFFLGRPLEQATPSEVLEALTRLASLVAQPDFPDGDVAFERQRAWNALMQQADYGLGMGGLRLGEVLVQTYGRLYELRHLLDEGRENESLKTYVTLDGLRTATKWTDDGQFRPVRTLRNLPRGWRAVVDAADLPDAITTLYPAVTEETFAHSQHALHWTPWATTARRYGQPVLLTATGPQVEKVAQTLCSRCLRSRLWAGAALTRTFLSGAPGEMPCPEACPLFVAAVASQG